MKDAEKKETEEEVKESFKDPDVPVELPVLEMMEWRLVEKVEPHLPVWGRSAGRCEPIMYSKK